jgi:kinesin family member 15
LNTKQEDSDPEMELKAMVHAIAAASQREAEAHETTISLANENEDLKLQLSAILEDSRRGGTEDLEVQLREMHHENEKLLGLYEDAMHERDELGRLVREMKEREECVVHERESLRRLVHDLEERTKSCLSNQTDSRNVVTEDVDMCIDVSKEKLQLVRTKLELVHGKLLSTDKAVGHMQLIEDACSEMDKLSTMVKSVHGSIEPKEESLKVLRAVLCQKQVKKVELQNLFSSLVSELDMSNSRARYLEQRETRIGEKVVELKAYLKQKDEELRCLQSRKEEIDLAYKKARENESKLRQRIDTLKMSLKSADGFKRDAEKVLSEVKNFKASDLLNSEMQRVKLVHEMNSLREQMVIVQKEIASFTKSREVVEANISSLDVLMCNWSPLVQKMEGMVDEIRVMGSTGGYVRDQLEELLPDYQEVLFEVELKNEELGLWEQSLCQERSVLDEVSGKLSLVMEKLKEILCQRTWVVPDLQPDLKGVSISFSVAKQLHEVCELVSEVKKLSVVVSEW